MANVSLVQEPKGVIQKLAFGYSRRKMHKVRRPGAGGGQPLGVLIAMGAMEGVVDKGWKTVDPHLRWLALQATAGAIGCSWCTDFGYFEGMQQGVDPQKVRDVFRLAVSNVTTTGSARCSSTWRPPPPLRPWLARSSPADCTTHFSDAGDRGADRLGITRELPLAVQRRVRAPQPGFL